VLHRPGSCNVRHHRNRADDRAAPGGELVVYGPVLEGGSDGRSRTCGRPASALAVSSVFVRRMTISPLDRSGRQSARSRHLLLTERVHCDRSIGPDRAGVLLAREELHQPARARSAP
jgi:hypothetical protein